MLLLKKMITVGLTGMLLLSATPAFAATAPHTLEFGARGSDVALMQRLLTFRGQPVAATALIGPTTQGLIKEFQQENGLPVTGVVDHNTWMKLYPTLHAGDRNKAVEALQIALNEKHGYGLAADGIYGPATVSAVRAFQQHMGLAADGIAGPQTWEALTAHFQGLEKSGTGFYRYGTINTYGNYGTGNTIAAVKQVAREMAELGYPRIGIGDISLPHGGWIQGHASHRRGVDVDMRILRTDWAETPVDRWDARYSRKFTQALVDRLLATGEVEVIFFNDPEVRGVTYWPNHDGHMHVRFRR